MRQLVFAQDGEIARVRVPGIVIDGNPVPEQVPGDVDKADACFDQSAADQRALAEKGATIAVEESRVFPVQVEGGLDAGRGEQVEGAFLDAAVLTERGGCGAAAEPIVDLLDQAAPTAESVDGEA